MDTVAARRARPAKAGHCASGRAVPISRVDVEHSYRDILGAASWNRLHPRVRRRFSVKPAAGASIRYQGVMRVVELSFMGWLFAQFCRLIGTPLAPRRGRDVPMSIVLERDPTRQGVQWLRRYRFDDAPAFDVRSTKTQSGSHELTEHLGFGFSMRLHLSEKDGNLYFVSHAYDVSLFGRRLTIPHWLTPGRTTVAHEQIGGARFRFTLAVEHPWFGRTIYQDGLFE